jgi:hypothetical protein
MLKGKNLWIVLGVGAVAYYLYMQKMKKDKAAKATKAALATTPGSESSFTGDLGVTDYQNASGRYVRKKLQFGAPAGQYGNQAILYTPLGR